MALVAAEVASADLLAAVSAVADLVEVLEAVASLAVALEGVGRSLELTVDSLLLTVSQRSKHRTYYAVTA